MAHCRGALHSDDRPTNTGTAESPPIKTIRFRWSNRGLLDHSLYTAEAKGQPRSCDRPDTRRLSLVFVCATCAAPADTKREVHPYQGCRHPSLLELWPR